MPLVCIIRPNRTARRIWTPVAVARVARYAAADLGDPAPVAGYVMHCLGFGKAICCCAKAAFPIEVIEAGVSLEKQVKAVENGIKALEALAAKLPRRLRRLIAPLLALLALLRELLQALRRASDVLDLDPECSEFAEDLTALCEQITILMKSDLTPAEVCHGPE